MKDVEKCFLEAYSISLRKEGYEQLNKTVRSLSEMELRRVLALAEAHMVLPMIFEAFYNANLSVLEKFSLHKRMEKAEKDTYGQARRTVEFLRLLLFLAERGLFPLVLKGIICRTLYPDPEQRASTDEDLLIDEAQAEQYHQAFLEYGLEQVSPDADIGHDHEVSYANGHVYIELHKMLFPPESAAYGDLNRFFSNVEDARMEMNIYGVPVMTMDPTDHVFYQICHAYKHFLNCGIGIRIVSDIVLYALHFAEKIDWDKVKQQCREINAFVFTSAIFRIGEKYLLPGHFPEVLKMIWETDYVDEKSLLEDILSGGIYGSSSEERLHSANITLGTVEAEKKGAGHSVLTRTVFPSANALQNRFSYLRTKPYLLPAAWMHRLFAYLTRSIFHKKNANGISEAVRIGRERVAIMQNYRIIGDRKKGSLLHRMYQRSKTTAIAPLLSRLFLAICSLEYAALDIKWYLQGERRPASEEQKLVRENVTFIIKSFERQGLVKGLSRNIHRMYPGTKVVIADDSREPLSISLDNVTVIGLPYNSGLGAGLSAALEQVDTPYVMRMDDDELLTIRSCVHKELQYLMEHEELDLIGFGHTTAIRLRSPEYNFKEYFQSPMDDAPLKLKVPHLTRLDENHIILGKVANIYLVRTEKLKKVGFDPEIKVIDHHEFFWRAAGVITSAAALDTVVFHRHDPYNRKYNLYRSDYRKDLKYIEGKRSRMLREYKNEKKSD